MAISMEERVAKLETFRETHGEEISKLRGDVQALHKEVTMMVASLVMTKWIITTAIALGPALGVLLVRLFG